MGSCGAIWQTAGVTENSEIGLGATIAGKYLIESGLGSGGMGTVLRAQAIGLHQTVAIKVMHRELLDVEDATKRFFYEGHATSMLKSPHVLRIYEMGTLPSGTPFMVMELLEGIDLGTMVAARGPLPLERVLHYLLQATDAIAEAHENGIIHRDIKPRNLFLNKDNVIKVVDFGLAKTLRPRSDGSAPVSARTSPNVLLGSPNYMSPEQLMPNKSVDERTDIYCLGATMYQLLAGEPLFTAANFPALIKLILTTEPPRVSNRRPDIPPIVDDVIEQCVRKNPDERYRSISALQNSLLHLKSVAERIPVVRPHTGAEGATMPADQLPMLPPVITGAEQPTSRSWSGEDEPTQTSLPEAPESDRDLTAPFKR